MTKKEKEEEEILLEDFDLEELEDILLEPIEYVEEPQEKKRPAGSLRIQPVEEYLLELGFRAEPKKLHKDFPDLFGVKLDSKNDMISETPGVEVSAENLFLSSLITLQKTQELEKLKKRIKGIHDKGKNKKVRDPE